MRTIETKLYKASELEGKAKDKAREWWRELEAQDFDPEFEPFETAAKILGITFNTNPVKLYGGGTRYESDIRYSGFHVQGSGASFTGTYEYAKGCSKAIRAEFGTDEKLWAIADGLTELQKHHGYKLTARIENSSRICGMSIEIGINSLAEIEDSEFQDIEKTILDLMEDFADWIYRELEEEYEYRMSDENVDDAMDANEYEFTEDGNFHRS